MVSDMGNNRVCIFKKYLINYKGNQYYRFRFFIYNDKNNTELIAPFLLL